MVETLVAALPVADCNSAIAVSLFHYFQPLPSQPRQKSRDFTPDSYYSFCRVFFSPTHPSQIPQCHITCSYKAVVQIPCIATTKPDQRVLEKRLFPHPQSWSYIPVSNMTEHPPWQKKPWISRKSCWSRPRALALVSSSHDELQLPAWYSSVWTTWTLKASSLSWTDEKLIGLLVFQKLTNY